MMRRKHPFSFDVEESSKIVRIFGVESVRSIYLG